MTEQEIIEQVSFPVELRPVFHRKPNGEYVEVPNKRAVARIDNDDTLAINSDQYKLLAYGPELEPIIRLNRKYCGTNVQRTHGLRQNPLRVEAGGRRIWLETTFNHEIKIGNDVIVPRIVYGNSYDCTAAHRLITGFYQIKCTNAGALIKAGTRLGGFGGGDISRRHRGNGQLDAFGGMEEHIKRFLENFGVMSQSLQGLANTAVPIAKAQEIFSQYVGPRAGEKKPLEPQDTESAWSFYARITNHLTFDYKGGQAQTERRAQQALQDIIMEAR